MTVNVAFLNVIQAGVIKKSTFSQAIKVNCDLVLSLYKKNFPGSLRPLPPSQKTPPVYKEDLKIFPDIFKYSEVVFEPLQGYCT